MEVDLVDRAGMTRQFVEDSPRRCVPDVDKPVTRTSGHVSAIRTPGHPQQVLQCAACQHFVKVKVVDLYSASTRSVSKVFRYSTHCQGLTQFYLHTLRFICKQNEPYLPLPSQPQLTLIYRPRWMEVASTSNGAK